jgi:mRNA-degrading endonuclease RelE of RelBE toxin-antitoxin system
MSLVIYSVQLSEEALSQFNGLDNSIKLRIKKYLQKLKTANDTRTLRGNPDIWVAQTDGYKVLYLVNNQTQLKTIFFIADHRKYEQLYNKMFGK